MTTFCQADVLAIFAAKTVRTFCYGFLGIVLPVYLSDLGLSAAGVGVAVTLTLAGSAALTWVLPPPAERDGTRAAPLAPRAPSARAARGFLSSRGSPAPLVPPRFRQRAGRPGGDGALPAP